jgi:hypothetical protein
MTIEEFEFKKTSLKKELKSAKASLTKDFNDLYSDLSLAKVLQSVIDDEVKENAVKVVALKTVDFVGDLAREKLAEKNFENNTYKSVLMFLAEIAPTILKEMIAKYGDDSNSKAENTETKEQ